MSKQESKTAKTPDKPYIMQRESKNMIRGDHLSCCGFKIRVDKRGRIDPELFRNLRKETALAVLTRLKKTGWTLPPEIDFELEEEEEEEELLEELADEDEMLSEAEQRRADDELEDDSPGEIPAE